MVINYSKPSGLNCGLWIVSFGFFTILQFKFERGGGRQKQKCHFKSVMLTGDCTILSVSSAFTGNTASFSPLWGLGIISVSNRFEPLNLECFWLAASNGSLFADFQLDTPLSSLFFPIQKRIALALESGSFLRIRGSSNYQGSLWSVREHISCSLLR